MKRDSVEPDGRMSPHRNDWRRTMVLFALTSLVESLAFGHLSAFTPLYLRELKVPESAISNWTGILSALAFVIGLPLLPFWGVWAERYGRKPVIIRSSVVAAIVFALSAASVDVTMLAATRLLSGFVFGNTGLMMALQADITPREKLGTSVAIVTAGFPVGMAVGPYLGGEFVSLWGIRALLYADAALTALVVVALMIYLREEPSAFGGEQSVKSGVIESLQAVRRAPAVTAFFACVFLIALGGSAAGPFTPLLVETLFQGPELPQKIGIVSSAFGIAMAAVTPLWGPFGDRKGHMAAFKAAVFGVALSLLGHAAAVSIGWLIAVRVAYGAFQGGVSAMSTVLLADLAPPERRATILNLSLLPNQISWFIGPLIGALFAKYSIAALFLASATITLAGLALASKLPRADSGPRHTVS